LNDRRITRSPVSAVLLATVGLAILVAFLAPPASAVPPRSYYELTILLSDEPFPDLAVRIYLDSPFLSTDTATTAARIDIALSVGAELILNGTAGGTLAQTLRNVTGDAWFNTSSRITDASLDAMATNPSNPYFTDLDVLVVYTDAIGARPRTIQRAVTIQLNYRPPSGLDAMSAAFAGLGGAGVIGLSLYVGRRARLEELYLMHDSGMLIRHWSTRDGIVRDTDIMSGMFIVLQEFVRDSFNDRKNNLERLRFGSRQVALVRGDRTVLAAVLRGRYLNGLPAKLRDAVGDFERHYGGVLKDWSGNPDAFPSVDVVAWRFMKGKPTDVAS